MNLRLLPLVACCCSSLASGCASSSSSSSAQGTTAVASPPQKRSLYDRLGGKDAITAVVADFVGNVAADARINAFFAKTDIPHLKQMLVEQICQATSGPCEYSGKDMRTVHTGLKIEDAHFTALVDDLSRSLDKFKVGEGDKKELVAALGGMKGDIVGR
jgi:hemoglobin